MKTLSISQPLLITPEEADSDLTEIFDETRRTTETPVVFNMWQTLANYFETLADALKLEVDSFLQGYLANSLCISPYSLANEINNG